VLAVSVNLLLLLMAWWFAAIDRLRDRAPEHAVLRDAFRK